MNVSACVCAGMIMRICVFCDHAGLNCGQDVLMCVYILQRFVVCVYIYTVRGVVCIYKVCVYIYTTEGVKVLMSVCFVFSLTMCRAAFGGRGSYVYMCHVSHVMI